MRTCMWLTVIGVALTAGDAGLAQSAVQHVQIELWPEYDRAQVLVIYNIDLVASGSPVTLEVRIPAAAGRPHAVAEAGPDGRLVNLPYERRIEGQQAVLTLSSRQSRVHVEYYDDTLERDGARRSYRFVWPGVPAAPSLTAVVQEPADARELRTLPRAISSAPGAGGLTYHRIPFAQTAPGRELVVELEYLKDTERLSVDTPGAQPLPDLEELATPRQSRPRSAIPPWAVGLAAFVVAGGGAWWWMGRAETRDRRSAKPRPAGRRHGGSGRRAPRPVPPEGRAARGTRYCTACGTAAAADHRFCRACGEPLR